MRASVRRALALSLPLTFLVAVPVFGLGNVAPTATPVKVPTATPVPKPKLPKILPPTATPTVALTATPTDTPTSEGTPTPTFSPTFTPTSTPTTTLTVTPTPGVFQFQISPRPDAEGKVHFQWGTNVPADEVYLKIYSSGFRVVHGFEFNKEQQPGLLTPGAHEVTWDGRDEQGRRIPPGDYFCFIDVRAGGKRYEASGRVGIP
jgi:hypothetical protein